MCILLHALSTQVPNSKTFHNVRYIHIVLLIIRPPKFHVILFGNAAEALHGVPRNNGEYQSKESDDQGIRSAKSWGRLVECFGIRTGGFIIKRNCSLAGTKTFSIVEQKPTCPCQRSRMWIQRCNLN